MLRALLRDSEAAKALFEKVGLFKTPELLEKYLIASEVTVEVLDLFLAEPKKEVEGLRVKVQDLEQQLCAVQRQLQMQGEVAQ